MQSLPIKSKKSLALITMVLLVIIIGAVVVFATRSGNDDDGPAPVPTSAPKPVNLIEVSKRPYVSLSPLTGRNELELTIHDLKVEASEVEITLEYDRNEGVMDAILRSLIIDKTPLKAELFMGSKSAGGHITYHDDVIGGTYTLDFEGDEPYALENPWRYDDSQASYDKISTADGKFQVVFNKPYKTPKILVMQSPGLPENVDDELVAGPYLFRGVGALPQGKVDITIRLPEESSSATLFGWDSESWQELDANVEGKTLTATTEVFDVYIVVN
jgi:hypothetical protein